MSAASTSIVNMRGVLLFGVVAAALVGGAALVGVRLLSDAEAPPREVAAAPIEWSGPVRQQGNAAVEFMVSERWSEAPDVAPAWADIELIEVLRDIDSWRFELRDNPPAREALARQGYVLGFGFVMDTTGDGAADYVVGIDSDAEPSSVHVWLTDLASGETEERFSGPYGDPFDFATTLEEDLGAGLRRPAGASFFNVGFAPAELFDLETTRFYAWSSLAQDGEVIAWDYAPNAAWLGLERRARLGCTPIECPMSGPQPGPGAREWIVDVENQSRQEAHLFVASDTGSLGDLVGTAVPASIGPGASQRVVFTVPAGSGWAIFVNPSPTMGPLVGAQDVPMEASGLLPIRIVVPANGAPSVSAPSAPGWFGN